MSTILDLCLTANLLHLSASGSPFVVSIKDGTFGPMEYL
jgi:hypothetical protein